MPLKVRFLVEAEKDVARLSQGKRKAVFDKLDEIKVDPHLSGSKPLREFDNIRRVKARDISIVYEPPNNGGEVLVVAVGKSPAIYSVITGRISD